jgi:hypothetical protein
VSFLSVCALSRQNRFRARKRQRLRFCFFVWTAALAPATTHKRAQLAAYTDKFVVLLVVLGICAAVAGVPLGLAMEEIAQLSQLVLPDVCWLPSLQDFYLEPAEE